MPRSKAPTRNPDTSNARCPKCDASIPTDRINVAEGIAQCPGCGELTRISQLNLDGRSLQEILARTPSGCSMVVDGGQCRVTASLQSWGGF